MSEDRGLSIFDEEQTSEEAPTQVIPRVEGGASPGNNGATKSQSEGQGQGQAKGQPSVPEQKSAAPDAAAPAGAPKTTAPASAPQTAAAGTPPRSADAAAQPPRVPASGANLPLVRRGGYDKDAVDQHLRTVAAEKAGLIASLNEAQ